MTHYLLRALSEFFVFADFEALFLALVPVPLVHLALAESESLRDALDEVAGPVRALQVLVLEYFQLLFVFALAALYVATIPTRLVVLSLLKKGCNTFVQVVELQLVVVDIEGDRSLGGVLGGVVHAALVRA